MLEPVRVASGDANDAGFAVVACAKAHALEPTRCLGHGLFHHDVEFEMDDRYARAARRPNAAPDRRVLAR